ncbi:Leptomycin B resistance protein pmd1 [Erysiphe neolycopersici]|uniref:Leptomycin B resistance protein pmd1 n=1 Tax=Erysiphe neolycopersici TaxID=212602 RepID=A0A420HRD9_9PEZI|nr:Leptomycin B resistance protein pmd1 [Erysiphe neolycopersici]
MFEFHQELDFHIRKICKMHPWKFYLNSLEKSSFFLFAAIAITALSSLLHPIAVILCGRIFGTLTSFSSGLMSPSEISNEISNLCLSLILLGCLAWIIEFCFMSLWIAYGERFAKKVRELTFMSLLHQDMSFNYLKKFDFAPLLVRLETQTRELQMSVSQPSGFIIFEIFSLISSVSVALYHAWQVALLFLVILPIMAIGFWLVSKLLESVNKNQEACLMKASKSASSSIKESITVKTFTAEDYELCQYKEILKQVGKSHKIQARVNALQIAVTKFVVALYFIGGFWLGLYMVIHGKDPGDILIAFYTTLAVMHSVEIVSTQWNFVVKGIAANNAISSLLHELQASSKNQNNTLLLDLPNLANSNIELKGVSFSYPGNPNQYILKNTNFFFPAHKTTYIVGKSGSGKSTIGMLIMGFYLATKGDILLDGKSLEKIPPKWLHENITLIDQESLLFNESIHQNIAFGRINSACREDVINAGKIANLEEMLSSLPNGLDNLVTKCGNSLSGGQRQKVVISRARLRDSPILILDEATSALDQASRELLNNEMLRWRANKTTIIITHDMSQIRDEFIYVIEKGQVVQKGMYKDLVHEINGVFASLLQNEKQKQVGSENITSKKLLDLSECSSEIVESDDSASKFQEKTSGWDKSSKVTKILFKNESRDTSLDITWLKSNNSTEVLVEPFSHKSDLQLKFNSLKSLKKLPNQISRWWKNSPESDTYSLLPNYEHEKLEKYNSSTIEQSQMVSSASNSTDRQLDILTKSILQTEDLGQESYVNPQILQIVLMLIWPLLSRKNKYYLSLGILASFITAISIPIFAFFISNLMNLYKSTSNQQKEGSIWVTALFGLIIIDFFSTYFSYYYFECIGQACVTKLRTKCFKNILAQPQAWLEDKRYSTSLLVQCLDRDAEEMHNLIGRFFGPALTTLWLLIVSVLWSLFVDWRLTIAALSCVPVIYIGSVAFNWITSKYEEKCHSIAECTSTIFVEAMMNIRMIRALNLESYFEKKYKDSVALSYSTGLYRSVYSGITYGFVSDTISYMTTALVVYYGTSLILKDLLTVLSFYQIINLLFFSLGHGLAIISLIPQVNSSRIAAKKLLFLANLPHNQSFESTGTQSPISPLPIVFKDLNFTYPRSARKVLKKINLTINENSFIVITGPSGSGKSTIVSLLLGLYAPDESLNSSLSFAGTPLEKYNIASLRSSMAFVPQDPVLFPDTIYANIAYGHSSQSYDANIEAVKQAAQDASIAEFIDSLENGFNTIIGEGGMGVSRGQAQRITIARAFFRNSSLLIMDEPTSALDTLSASHIRGTLKKMSLRRHSFLSPLSSRPLSLVIISHSIEMMAISDHIIVLDKGEIVERGEFQDLWNQKNGTALWKIINGRKEV